MADLKGNTYRELGHQARWLSRRRAVADAAMLLGGISMILVSVLGISLVSHVVATQQELESGLCQAGIATPELARSGKCKAAGANAAAAQAAFRKAFFAEADAHACVSNVAILHALGYRAECVGAAHSTLRVIARPPPPASVHVTTQPIVRPTVVVRCFRNGSSITCR